MGAGPVQYLPSADTGCSGIHSNVNIMTELPVVASQPPEGARLKKPHWLRVKLPIGESYRNVRNLVDTHQLHTICESGNCPNMGKVPPLL
jgi:lipoate synthase